MLQVNKTHYNQDLCFTPKEQREQSDVKEYVMKIKYKQKKRDNSLEKEVIVKGRKIEEFTRDHKNVT